MSNHSSWFKALVSALSERRETWSIDSRQPLRSSLA